MKSLRYRTSLLLVLTLCVAYSARCLGADDSAPAGAATIEKSPASEPYWPEFHGPKRDNISPETGLLKRWPEGGPKLIWEYAECGIGYSGISIADGRIYCAGDFGREAHVFALDLDGKLLWKSPNGKAWTGSEPGSRTTPTYCDGSVYHMTSAWPAGRLPRRTTARRSGRST